MTQLAPAPLSSEQCEPVTTNGTIAVANLHAQIDGLAVQSRRAGAEQAATTMAVPARAQLIDLLTLRGDVLGRIADYELAAELAECLVRDAPDDGTAWLTRAKTRATFHRFAMALDDLDAAGRNGLGPAVMDCRGPRLVRRRPAPGAGIRPGPGPARPDRGGPGRPRSRYCPAALRGPLQR